jgi:hypothetical protein
VKKPTISQLFLGAVYCVICFFILGITVRYGITFFYTKGFDVNSADIYKTFLMSCVAGIGGSAGAWIMAKIDARKNNN